MAVGAEQQRPANSASNLKAQTNVPTWDLPRNQLLLATGGTMLALLLAALDQTVVGTALPRIVSELNGLNYYPWVITAYLVSSTTMTPVVGKLGDLFGRKPMLLLGMAGFMAGSALCGLSQSMIQLILFRAIQGLFAGFLFGTVFSVVADLYPPQRRGKIQGLFGGVWGVASILGPPTGGLLTDNVGWRWVFYINIPVGLIAVALVAFTLPFVRSRASWRQIDFLGAVALIGFLAPLLIGLSLARDSAWTSPLVIGLLVLAAVMLAAFLVIEARAERPILPLELFRNPTFSAAMAIAFFSAFGMFATIIYGPLVFQGVLGVSPTNSGALTIPMSVGQIGASVLIGNLMWHIGRYRLLGTVGIAAMIAGMWLMSQVTVGTPPARASLIVLMIGFGLGTTFPLTMNSVQNALPRQFVGVASSQVQFFRAVGGTLATAVLGAVLTQRLSGNIKSEIDALHLAPQTVTLLTNRGGANPQTLFDPANIERVRATLPPGQSSLVDTVLDATRLGLAHTLHDLFITGAAIVGLALIASLFLREVTMRTGERTEAVAAEVPRQPTTVGSVGESRQPVGSIVATGGEAEAPAEDKIQHLGSRYLGDLAQALRAEIEKPYEVEFAANEKLVSELKERAATAEHRHSDLEKRMRKLEEELEGRAREIDQIMARHKKDLDTLGGALVRLGLAVERTKGRVGMSGQDSIELADVVAESEQRIVVEGSTDRRG